MVGFFECHGGLEVYSGDLGLTISNGVRYYKKKAFTGKLVQKIGPSQVTRVTPFQAGKEHGRETTVSTTSGLLLEERYYSHGKKTGVHRGWYKNGKYRFYTEFENGKNKNEFWDWHRNGNVYRYIKYDKTGEILVAKVWRSNGQIYSNQLFKEGKFVGLGGNALCDRISEQTLPKKEN